MNRTKLKAYAPQARRDFIQAITNQAVFFGLTASEVKPVEIKGDLAFIGGQAFPRSVVSKRASLEHRIALHGFAATMEAIAYTWFNRLTAIRFMELHGYLDHGFRVLSHPEGKSAPEILEQAEHVSLPGLDPTNVLELKLDGTKDAELYRRLLIAQCNALHTAMPFLFERIDDETELLLPENLLHSDSIIRKLVAEIDEADWQDVEIIGWLYQFYISEKKDDVIGKVVKSEDIPAATQLFTPNWIVKYMVHNSVGRMWLATYPESSLRTQMEYYIEPAKQSPDVTAQLAAITPTTLDPERLTVLDPACGSGHILVEAYDVLKAIYLERGYRLRDIPRLILEKNLFGLDIDDRAAQLAGFALLMKARQDDRRILQTPPRLNILAIQELTEETTKYTNYTKENQNQPFSLPFDTPNPEPRTLNPAFSNPEPRTLNPEPLLSLFHHAKTYGSLIRIPAAIAAQLPQLTEFIEKLKASGDMFEVAAAHQLEPFVRQAELLARKYDCVVANPPYMGSKGMNQQLKDFAGKHFKASKSDMFAMFIEQGFEFVKPEGFNAMVTMQSWMFLSSFEEFRETLLNCHTIQNLLQLPYDGKGPTAMGISFGISVATFRNRRLQGYKAHFSCARYFELNEEGIPITFPIQNERLTTVCVDDFRKIPGSPIAYWVSEKIRKIFSKNERITDIADARQGLATTDNGRFVRFWWEVCFLRINLNLKSKAEALNSREKWFPFNKGGAFRKWYGNIETIVNWEKDGNEIKTSIIEKYPYLNGNPDFVAKNQDYYFRESITWSDITSSNLSFRYLQYGFIPSQVGHSAFANPPQKQKQLLGFLNTRVLPIEKVR